MGSNPSRFICECPPVCGCQCLPTCEFQSPVPSICDKAIQIEPLLVHKRIQARPELQIKHPSIVSITPSPMLTEPSIKSIDLTSLHKIVENVNFSTITDEKIHFSESAILSATINSLCNNSFQEKLPDDNNCKEKLISNGIANTQRKIHTCFNASVSKEVGTKIAMLRQINKEADEILQKRLSIIALEEEKALCLINQEQQSKIQEIVKNADVEVNRSEKDRQKIIQKLNTKLEVTMSHNLNELNKQVEIGKGAVIACSHSCVAELEMKVKEAKIRVSESIQKATMLKQEQIFNEISNISLDKACQATKNVQFVTDGEDEAEQDHETMAFGGRSMEESDQVKKHQQIKRTIYITTDTNSI